MECFWVGPVKGRRNHGMRAAASGSQPCGRWLWWSFVGALGGFGVALGWLWGGFGVAIGWLSTRFGVALGWLWVALHGEGWIGREEPQKAGELGNTASFTRIKH